MIKEKILAILKETQIDALLISDGYNVRYISGFSGATGYLYISSARQVIMTDSRYTMQARQESKEFEVVESSADKSYAKMINDYLKTDKARCVGFEDQHFIYADLMTIKNGCDIPKWIPLGDTINRLRVIKTPEEIEKLAMAESIGDQAFTYILDILKPGITELEVAARLECFMKLHGAEGLSFDTIVASGRHSAMPHAAPSRKKLEYGDFVTMDYGCLYEGYCSDMTRTVVIGKAGEKQKKIYGVVLEAQLRALDGIIAGKTGQEIDAIARRIIEQAGYGAYFGHGLGHSVGLYIHEEPRLSPVSTVTLQENMIETVEPGIYVPDFGGVRIEDMVAVTQDGCRNLTNSPKHLIEI